MRFALMIEPQQGLTYEEQLEIALRAEAAGFETLFRSDHYESFPGEAGPAHDGCLGGAGRPGARDTSGSGSASSCRRSRSGRRGTWPRSSVTVDEMSGGRVEVGVGAGWHEDEHRRHGFPFPEIGERADASRRRWRSSTGCGRGRTAGRSLGRHYAVEDALFRPKPA